MLVPYTFRSCLDQLAPSQIIPLSNPSNGVEATVRIKKGQVGTSQIAFGRVLRRFQVFHIPFTTMNTSQAWGPSASVFDPSRWLEEDRDPATLPPGWSGLMTFCAGPRNCIGYRLGSFSLSSSAQNVFLNISPAILEFKIILATLIRSFVFEDTGAVIVEKISPTLQPVVEGKGGRLPLSLRLV